MPVTAIAVQSKGKITALTVQSTEEGYKEYLAMNPNAYVFPISFVKEYLNSNNVSIKFDKGIEKYVIATEKFQVYWNDLFVVDMLAVKEILAKADLSYFEFIDKYAEHLKNIQ